MEYLPLGRIAALMPEFAMKDLPLDRTLMMIIYILYIYIYISFLPKGRSFTANLGTKAAILPKGRYSIANSGT